MPSSNSTRIAKNTFFLYLRSLIVLAISLYSSRVILRTLGASDFGLYSVVGGVVAMLSFLSTSMQASYQRFFAYALGKGKGQKVLNMFHCSLTVQAIVAVIILVLAETVGLWFLNTKMTIDADRMVAANWVYQASIISFIFVIFQAPFLAIVTSYERMDFFAFISIFDAIVRLGIVFLLQYIGGDKLITYALLILVVGLVDILLYILICTKKLEVSSVRFGRDKKLIKDLASFGGWGMMDSFAYTLKSNGLNIVINLFFGTIVNAARGIAYQVMSAVNQFISAFQNSFRPQMTKSYAAGDISYLKRIYYSCTKLSYYLIITISLPILLETPYILHLWLGDVPEHTVSFTRIVLATTIVSAFANPTSGIAYSTGRIKWFTVFVSSVNLLIVPVAYIFLWLGFPAESAMIVSLVFTIIAQIVRLIIVRRLASMPLAEYVVQVVLPTFLYTLLVPIVPLVVLYLTPSSSFVRLVLVTVVCFASSLFAAWTIGLTKSERQFVLSKISRVLNKRSLKH